jgi:AAA domain, putative AbiEii toxin, Type IV TA system/RecF/RecN/SMC N terminal domain
MLLALTLENFKSFRHAELELSPRLTLLVGANASGKSNVFDAIRFLQGLALGMSPADVLRGRWEGGREVWPGIRGGVGEITKHGEPQLRIRSRWSRDSVSYDHDIAYTTNPRLGITVEHAGPTGSPIYGGDDRGMLGYVEKDNALAPLADAIRSTFFLDLNPRRMRDYVPKTSTQLGAEGQNLSAAVWQLCQDTGRKQDLLDWMSELCAPALADIDFVETELGDVMLVLVEQDGARVSARSLSDGTLRFLGELTALLTAPRGSLILIEEIENGLHPARIHLLVELLTGLTAERDVQILATTHSPAVLGALADTDLELAKAALVFGRVPNEPGTVARRLGDLPHFDEVVQRRGIEHLFTTQWLERAL